MVQDVSGNEQVQKKVAIENDNVPAQHGLGKIQDAEPRDQVPNAVSPPQVGSYEHEAHAKSGHCEPLAHDHDILDGTEVVEICGMISRTAAAATPTRNVKFPM